MNDRDASLRHLAPVFRVRDLARSIRFYEEQLGFELDFSYEDFYASVRRDGCYIHLKCASPTARDQGASGRDEELDACVEVSSAEKLAAEFSAAGASFSAHNVVWHRVLRARSRRLHRRIRATGTE